MMSKVTLSVCKTYKNTGNLRSHREKTKKHWKHYFIDTDDGCFHTEWVSSIKAQILKRRIWKKKKMVCLECGCLFYTLVKKETDECTCPNCDD